MFTVNSIGFYSNILGYLICLNVSLNSRNNSSSIVSWSSWPELANSQWYSNMSPLTNMLVFCWKSFKPCEYLPTKRIQIANTCFYPEQKSLLPINGDYEWSIILMLTSFYKFKYWTLNIIYLLTRYYCA